MSSEKHGCDPLEEELKRIFLEAEYRKGRGDNPEFVFMDLAEELEKVSRITGEAGGQKVLCEEEILRSKKELAVFLGVDYTVPWDWIKNVLDKVLKQAQDEKDDPVPNETQFDQLRREIELMYVIAHGAVNKLWNPQDMEASKGSPLYWMWTTRAHWTG